MSKGLRHSLSELKIISYLIFIFFLGFQVINMIVTGSNSAISQGIAIWVYASDMIDFFVPLLFTAPFVWLLFFKVKSHFTEYVSMRMSLKKYLSEQILAIVLSVFLIAFLDNFFAMLLGIYVIPYKVDPDLLTVFQIPVLPFNFRTENPLVFAFFASLWKAFIASVFAFSASILACTVKNIFIPLFGIFAYV